MRKEKPIAPIYERIKKAFNDALDKEVSDKEIAEAVKVRKSAVSQWKYGDTSPKTDHLLLIAELTGVPFASLRGENDLSDVADENNEGDSTEPEPMSLEKFIIKLQALGVEDVHSIKSMEKLTPTDMEEIIAVAENNAKVTAQTTAQTMIKQRIKAKK